MQAVFKNQGKFTPAFPSATSWSLVGAVGAGAEQEMQARERERQRAAGFGLLASQPLSLLFPPKTTPQPVRPLALSAGELGDVIPYPRKTQLVSDQRSQGEGFFLIDCKVSTGLFSVCNTSNGCTASCLDNPLPGTGHAYLLETSWQEPPEQLIPYLHLSRSFFRAGMCCNGK